MYINATTVHLLARVHHSLAKRGGIEKQSLFLQNQDRSRLWCLDTGQPLCTPFTSTYNASTFGAYPACFGKQAGDKLSQMLFTLLNNLCCFCNSRYNSFFVFFVSSCLHSDFFSSIPK